MRVEQAGRHGETYASSKPVMAFLIPSDPKASVPYGRRLEPETLLSSETFSDSSLSTGRCVSDPHARRGGKTHRSSANTRAMRPTAMILFLMTFRRSMASPSDESGDMGDVGIIATSSSSNSSFVQVLSTATSMSVTELLASVDEDERGRHEMHSFRRRRGGSR